jgi:hypothetical protein
VLLPLSISQAVPTLPIAVVPPITPLKVELALRPPISYVTSP